MVRITIDEKLKEQLLASGSVVELCDESGKLVARALPAPPQATDPWALFPELTEEEIQSRCNSNEPGLTTDQVKQHLLQRGNRS